MEAMVESYRYDTPVIECDASIPDDLCRHLIEYCLECEARIEIQRSSIEPEEGDECEDSFGPPYQAFICLIWR